MKMNYDEFEVIKPVTKRRGKQVVSVFENGFFAVNHELVQALGTNQFEVRMKKDCSQMLLVPNGAVLTAMGKNNRIKNYAISERLEKGKIKFPAYFVGEVDEHGNWMGDLVTKNPNKHGGKMVK